MHFCNSTYTNCLLSPTPSQTVRSQQPGGKSSEDWSLWWVPGPGSRGSVLSGLRGLLPGYPSAWGIWLLAGWQCAVPDHLVLGWAQAVVVGWFALGAGLWVHRTVALLGFSTLLGSSGGLLPGSAWWCPSPTNWYTSDTHFT